MLRLTGFFVASLLVAVIASLEVRGAQNSLEATQLHRFFAKCTNLPSSWTAQNPLDRWAGLNVSIDHATGRIKTIAVEASNNSISGPLDATALAKGFPLVALNLSYNMITAVDFSKLPSAIQVLDLRHCSTLVPTPAVNPVAVLPTGIAVVDLSFTNIGYNTTAKTHAPLPDLATLPRTLISLKLYSAGFAGSIRGLGHCAASKLQVLELGSNWFRGPLDLRGMAKALPELQYFSVEKNRGLNGTLDAANVPRSLQTLLLKTNAFTGAVDVERLPATLVQLDLSFNQFNGTVAFHKLPPALQLLKIYNNQFTGRVDLAGLPAGLTEVAITNNRFSGPLDLTRIGGKPQLLFLDNNAFNGTLDLTALPATLVRLYVNANNFSGTIDISKFPPSLLYVDVAQNALSGTIDFARMSRKVVHFECDYNRFTGSIVPSDLPPNMTMLYAMGNNFTGGFDFSKLPRTMQYVEIDHNQFSGPADLTKLPPQLLKLTINDNKFGGTLDVRSLPHTMVLLLVRGNGFSKVECGSWLPHSTDVNCTSSA